MPEKNIALELVIGVPRAPADPYTNEPELEVINLLNISGFAVETDGWVPQLPSIKGGGLWADSALSAGRQLIAGEVGNVVETMTLVSSGASLVTYLYLKSRLLQFAQRAKAFHTDWNEMQPCYLKWQAPGSQIPQYAVIYSIDVAVEDDAFDGDNLDTVVITLEREPAWRMGVPPGGNPIEWTYFSRDVQRGSGYQYDDMILDSANSLVTRVIQNRQEWAYNAGNPVTTPISQNYIDISAAQVPGDAPALVCVTTKFTTTPTVFARRLLVWHSSKKLTGIDQDAGLPLAASYIINANDMTGGFPPGVFSFVAGTAANAVFDAAAVPARRFARFTFAAAGSGRIETSQRRQLLRGRMAVFVRARMAAGTLGDVMMQVQFSERATGGTPEIALPLFNVPVSTEYRLLYGGEITIPFQAKAHIGLNGRGIYNRQPSVAAVELDIRIAVVNIPAAARTVELLDLILVPYDEAYAELKANSAAGTDETFILDNTGYVGRAESRDVAVRAANSTYGINSPYTSLELQGNAPMLLPRTDQRLYFLCTEGGTGVADSFSAPDTDMTVRLNIVPRCYGVAAL